MSLSSDKSRAGPYVGNSLTTQFFFTFKTLLATDITVFSTDSTGLDTQLTQNADYTVSLNLDQDGAPGGFITFAVAPDNTVQITILRSVTITQGATLTNQGGFYPKVIEDALDKLTMAVQQINEQVGRAYKSSVVSTAIGTIVAYTAQAQAAAASALGYSNNAANSAATASNSSINASNFAIAAQNSAILASTPNINALTPIIDSFMNGPSRSEFSALYIVGGWDWGSITGSSPFLNENFPARRACLSNGSSSINFGTVP